MAVLAPEFVAEILLSGRAGARLLNESPVMLSVWTAYAADPYASQDLLLTPLESTPASTLARELHERLIERRAKAPRRITPIEGAVAACLDFDSFVLAVLPMTGLDLRGSAEELIALMGSDTPDRSPKRSAEREDGGRSVVTLGRLLSFAGQRANELAPELRATLLVALILGARNLEAEPQQYGRGLLFASQLLGSPPADHQVPVEDLLRSGPVDDPKIWRVSMNRTVERMGVSIETIKADAAQRVFEVDCRTLTWAVLDSGIDGSHPAFRDHDAGDYAIRIDKAYDFSGIRELASYDTLLDGTRMDALLDVLQQKLDMSEEEAAGWLARLREDADLGRPYDWEALSALLEVAPDKLAPASGGRPDGHGTHVAGILAGDWREGERVVHRGVCPNLRLYDLRILGAAEKDTEFAVIAALAFVRWLNGRNRYLTIHGANLSIGLKQELESSACGRTPVCLACEATVASGVTVVAAAGNWGTQDFLIADGTGSFRSYAPISIADPGNADSVITVGATHRERPHEYGVSFFSSRGPTGDGRAKPDLVAPGERVDGPLPDLGYGRLDGTSMAAPHVSGVAAMLMARNPEMIGDPRRVKAVIVGTATDLGRERHFQGAGLVDALRALQAV